MSRLETRVISGDEARRMCPALSENVTGASYCEAEGFMNPLQVAPAFARSAAEAGATIQVSREVLGITTEPSGRFAVETNRGRMSARYVVVAAGASGGSVARMVGLEIPVAGTLLQVHVLSRGPQRSTR